MKYKEFIEFIEEKGCEIDENEKELRVYLFGAYVWVSKKHQGMITISIGGNDVDAMEVAGKAMVLAKTPLEEREGGKKYRIKLKNPDGYDDFLYFDKDFSGNFFWIEDCGHEFTKEELPRLEELIEIVEVEDE